MLTVDATQSSPHLLLIEDNAADAKLLTFLFELEGFRGVFHWVKNGEEALNFLFRQGEFVEAPRPDLVILDLNLPRISGCEILRAIRNDVQLKELSVIVMTTSSSESDRKRIEDLHASGFFTKPRDLEDYEALVRNFVGWLVDKTANPLGRELTA